ncbi:MAG: hypothetical protein HOI95_23805, partial [Chromatiales bacterium]|nr:hypothetical protein [Chromatiales bacterium]
DTKVEERGAMSAEAAEGALTNYAALLEESIAFYEWLYDPRYGRNLSVGMVAGYLLSESFLDRNTIELWDCHRPACIEVLDGHTAVLHQLIEGSLDPAALLAEDRSTRYFRHLINKSDEFGQGNQAWLNAYGNLSLEFSRYAEALVGDYARNPNISVLKPIWDLEQLRYRGGAHYGRVHTMLAAVEECKDLILEAYRGQRSQSTDDGSGPVTQTDFAIQQAVTTRLHQDYPNIAVAGEHSLPEAVNDASEARWNLDPIDGTGNFIHKSADFAISIAHERHGASGAWRATDAVVAMPIRNERFWAEVSAGAYHIDATGFESRLAVDETMGVDGALVDCSLRGLGDAESDYYARLQQCGIRLRVSGSAAIAIAKVAGRGNCGAVITANDYDVSAGLLVATEAGALTSSHTFERDGRSFTAYVVAQSAPLLCELNAQLEQIFDSRGWRPSRSL